MDEINVRHYGDRQTEITISDYRAPGHPLVFDLDADQAADLRDKLRPLPTGAVTPAKAMARAKSPIQRYGIKAAT